MALTPFLEQGQFGKFLVMEWLVDPNEIRNWNIVVWRDDQMYRKGHVWDTLMGASVFAVHAYSWADKIWVGYGGGIYQQKQKKGWVISR